MILSVSRYTAGIEVKRDAETGQKLLPAFDAEETESDVQHAQEPQSQRLNNDAVFDEE
jgi:hypothetical protein